MNKEWLAVFEALRSVYTDGAYSNMAINEALSHHKGCKESFVRNYAKGVLRESIRLNYIIDKLADKGIDRVGARPLIILRMGLYAIDSLDRVPDHAAVSESVDLAKKVSRGSERFINAVLRSYLRNRGSILIPEDRLDLKYSVCEPVVSLLKDQYPDEFEEILKGLNEPGKTVIRVNSLRISRDEVINRLMGMGIEAEPSDESYNAVIASGRGIVSSELYRDGLISLQSLSSILAIEALHPLPGSDVLDLCAAPGGKSAYMAEMMQNRGSITACDIHAHKLVLIDNTMKRLGIDITETRLSDATIYDEIMKEKFDYVLADVPCSGIGVMASKPELKFRSNPGGYKELAEIQKKILENSVRYAKPGGIIEYSTCTLNKNENEKVIEHVMRSELGSLLSVLEMKTLMPYNCKVGFFYCTMIKNPSR